MFKTENLYQNDDRWKNKELGNSNETIGGWGCLLTSVTMMLNGIGYEETPATVNDKMKAKGGFQGAFFIPSVLPYAFPNVIYKDMEPCENFPAPISRIDAAVAQGKPVIVQVDWNKKAGIQTHFVLIKEKKGDDYVIYDPYQYPGDNSDKDVLLTQRYKYNGQKLASEISAVLWFDAHDISAQPPEEPEPVPVPADSMTVFVAVDDLAFRMEPSLGGYLIKRFEGDTALKSLESASATKSKLGAQGQWLHVQDSDGKQGYVAAWYLKYASETTAAEAEETVAPIAEVSDKVKVTARSVSFRSEPKISSTTFIRYLALNEELTIAEPEGAKKIGSSTQWLKVKDASGREGYVAAWFVAR